MTTLHRCGVAIALAFTAQVLTAQQPNASAAAFGMAGNYTAAATGYDAVAWNPAVLGLGSAPSFTLNLISGNATSGLNPVKFNDISAYGGQLIPTVQKEQWLRAIGSGTESGTLDGGVSIVALSVGRVGFQLGASGSGFASINEDAAEAILFGNAGRTAPRSMNFNGSNANGSLFATGAASVALPTSWKPMGGADEQFAIGITGKYVMALGMARAQDNGSIVTPDNITVSFPVIYGPTGTSNFGSGVGLDLGVAWTNRGTSLGATVRNVVNSFSWSTTALRSTPGTVKFDGTTNESNFDESPYAAAPAQMRAALEAEKFKPEVAVGFAKRSDRLTLTADASQRIGDGIDIGPKMHVGVGAEYRGISMLPLRAGIAAVTDGFQAAAGVGFQFGRFEIGGGVSLRSRSAGSEVGGMVSLVSIR